MSEPATRPIRSGVVLNLAVIIFGLVAIVALLVSQALDGEAGSSLPLDMGLELSEVASGLETPVLLIGTGDGSGDRYVVEQVGRIRRLSADDRIDDQPVLDFTDHVALAYEQGLLGLALHPDHAENGRLFVYYTRAGDGAVTVSEFTLVPGERTIDPATERTLLTIPQPYPNHNGGMLAFDREGMLLAGVGDGGSAGDPQGNGQDSASLLGTLLRLDVDRGWPYATPPDNGFADVAGARPEIHAIGLRNPWRFSVDFETGHIYIGDVGQNRWEEIDVLARGAREADFGWAQMEGRECYDGAACDPAAHLLPAVAYSHDDGDLAHCTVIGGYAYRGEAGTMPAGTYLYADYCSRTLWAVDAQDLLGDDAQPVIVGRPAGEYGQITSFGQDDSGELYLLTDRGYVLGVSATDADGAAATNAAAPA